MNQKTLFVLSASLLAQLTCAHSAVISYNWDYYGTIPTNSTSLAGVVSAANWNNSYDGTGASTTPPTVGSPELNLIDDSGDGTTMDIHFSGTAQWHLAPFWNGAPQDVDGTYNKSLLKGYVDMVGGNPVTISLAEIPYAQYDIYIYMSSDTAGREGYVTDTASTFFFSTYGSDAISGDNAAFIQATETGDFGTNAAATYARFSNLTGSSQSLSVFAAGNGGIAGIQVVQVRAVRRASRRSWNAGPVPSPPLSLRFQTDPAAGSSLGGPAVLYFDCCPCFT